MQSHPLSRRAFVLGAAAPLVAAAAARGQSRGLTAQDVVERIRARAGVPWREQTVDGFKAGDPGTGVTGVATAVMPTMEVLRTAAAARQNLIIVQEPTFYAADDAPGPRAADPVYLAKKAFIEEQHLVVWRFSDHWNARQPNEAVRALTSDLGWTGSGASGMDAVFQVPETTLGALTSRVRTLFGVRGGLRTVGEPGLRVRTVFVSPGTTDMIGTVRHLDGADIVLSGEPREWEAVPYTLDTSASGTGQPKGMIALGRIISEGPSARACADWVRSLVPEVPVAAIRPVNPYWSPLA